MKTNHTRRAACLFTALLTFLLVSTISAQEFRGTIGGTVTDPNGAAVPGASVTVKNIATNIANSVTSSDEGSYTVPFLQPGNYAISATASGFKTTTIENVKVQVDGRLTVDLQLQVGAAAEVNIVADTGVIEQGSVTTGTLVSQRQIEELPLAEGAPYTLATQAPGIVYTGDPNFQGPTANGNLASFRSNGTQGNQVNGSGGNVINLDGSPNLAYDGQAAFTPPSEATQEFKVQTNTFDAQMGFTAGATINVAVKSGSNDFHGSAYLYDRDKSRTANNFFNNRAGLHRPERKYNRYGAVISGPIFKDRTFFLFSYERQKDNVAQTTTYSVPTALMRQGNFSEVLGAGRTVVLAPTSTGAANCAGATGTVFPLTNRDGSAALAGQIYNPFTGISVTRCNPLTGTSQTMVERLPFAGNIITPGLIYGPARSFLQYFPEANLSGTQNNFITDQNLNRPYRSYMVKIDHNINDNNRISGKFYHSRNTEDRYNLTQEQGGIFQGFENRRNNGGNANWTSTLSSNFILDVRGSVGMFKLKRFQEGQPTAGELGFTGIPVARQDNVFPRFDFTNFLTVGSLRADYNDGRDRPFQMFTFQPVLTQIYGNHTLRYGYDFRRLREKFDYLGYASGRFQFQGTYTMRTQNDGNTERDRVGRDLAAFLLGVPVASTSSLIDNPQIYDVSSMYHGMFVHDDFRVTSKLTLNLGLRYEFEPGYTEKEGRLVTDFDRAAPSPLRAAALANYNSNIPSQVPITTFQNLAGGFVFASDGSTANQKTDTNNWQPRIGFSYAINDKTVIRGGFGIFTSPFQLVTQSVLFQPGFSTPTLFVPTTDNGINFIATLQNPFPTGIAASPGSALGAGTFIGRDLTSVGATGPTTIVLQNDRKNANYTRFIVGIQREVWWGLGLEATYVHSSGSDLAVNRELNVIPREFLVDLATVSPTNLNTAISTANGILNANVPNPFRTLVPDSATWNASTIQRRRLLTPFPQFGNVSVTEYNGSSRFDSLQFQIVKRFTKGLSLNASYTYSREHLKNQYLNPQDTELTEYISPNERPHRWTFSSIYELPFGKGRTWGSNWNPVVDALIGGWQLQGLYERQSGEPLVLPNVFYNGDPNQLEAKLGKKDGSGLRYGIDIPAWNISGFYLNGAVPAVGNNYTSSNAVTLRNFPLTVDGLRNQRFLKFDVGLSKNFRIREGMKIQVRVEAINLLNRPYFSSPTVTPGSLPTTTGGVTNYLGSFGFTNAPVRQPPRDIQIGGRFTF
ncbi:MAG: carboxypeptidase-like regulatory domain-containing protein [Acidobacteriota bacterium]